VEKNVLQLITSVSRNVCNCKLPIILEWRIEEFLELIKLILDPLLWGELRVLFKLFEFPLSRVVISKVEFFEVAHRVINGSGHVVKSLLAVLVQQSHLLLRLLFLFIHPFSLFVKVSEGLSEFLAISVED
jgi:hypothetical protein